MTSVRLDAGDLRTFGAHLAGKGPEVALKAAIVLRKSAMDLERNAKAMSPVDTGNLRNSIFTTFSGGGTMISAEVGPSAHYGGYVEDGTSINAPQPYMGPATEMIEGPFLSAIAQLSESL